MAGLGLLALARSPWRLLGEGPPALFSLNAPEACPQRATSGRAGGHAVPLRADHVYLPSQTLTVCIDAITGHKRQLSVPPVTSGLCLPTSQEAGSAQGQCPCLLFALELPGSLGLASGDLPGQPKAHCRGCWGLKRETFCPGPARLTRAYHRLPASCAARRAAVGCSPV